MCNSILFLPIYIVSLSFIGRETLSLSIIIIKNLFSANKWTFTKMLNEMNVLLFTCKFDIVWSTHFLYRHPSSVLLFVGSEKINL